MPHNYIYESKVSNLKIEHVENKILGTADYHRFYIVLCDDIQIAVSEHLTAEALTELIEGRDIKLATLARQRDKLRVENERLKKQNESLLEPKQSNPNYGG